jgi:ubiquitin C-terminal hydrolase
MPCGKKKLQDVHGLNGLSVDDLRKKVKLLYPYLKNLHLMKRQELCDLLSKDCENIGGLKNQNNSCYLDSALVSLFHSPSPYIKQNILDKQVQFDDKQLEEIAVAIQLSLQKIYAGINQGNTGFCQKLRKLFQAFDERYSEVIARTETLDWKTTQLEPSDVYKLLIRVFDIQNDCTFNFKSFGIIKNRKISVSDDQRVTTIADPIISADLLFGQKNVDIKEHIPRSVARNEFDNNNKWRPEPNLEFDKQILEKTYTKSPMLIIHISRVFGDVKLKTQVIPQMAIKLKNNPRSLLLRSILVHQGNSAESGHYVCFIRCKKLWYLYNDISYEKMKLIGDHDKLFKYNKNYVLKNAVDLVYW